MHTYVFALAGGVLIGLAALGLLYSHGRLAGVSGILANAAASGVDRSWRLLFLLGLVASGLLLGRVRPDLFAAPAGANLGTLVVAGVLAGFGARLGGGCTSGHGICGVGSGSLRSIAATATFMATGIAVVHVARHYAGMP